MRKKSIKQVFYEPRQRTALDGVTWWVVFDKRSQKYSTLLCHGRYKTKKTCQSAIENAEKQYRLNK